MSIILTPGVFKHVTCRNNIYPKSIIVRFHVPDNYIFWSSLYEGYKPPTYTAPHIKNQVWADPDLEVDKTIFKPKWNCLDGNINRISYHGCYDLDNFGYPLNPMGRTGLRGRGLLGRWGPNHAADPIVTRWKRNEQNDIIKHSISGKNILQMVAIQRHDNKMWAIPGGMVDPGEQITETLKREFIEEALDGHANTKLLEQLLQHGKEIYKGYVDDYRNTDNSWIETAAYNYHDETGSLLSSIHLSAGDDAANVKWCDIDSNLHLHANHINIINEVAKRLSAHW